MKPEIKREWLAALRAGKYKQGRKRLCHNDYFCCLGVLCDLSITDGLGEWQPDIAYHTVKHFTTENHNQMCVLPEEVEEWAGVHGAEVLIPDLIDREGHGQCLTDLNDKGLTFDQIADIIEHFL